ncbi:ATP-binding protein, partial [Pelagibacteraceae bacterium]|nr:ATP-binding protein [Pelagibacteraceae bacterium]
INGNKDYINIILSDNGLGIKDTSIIMTPYFTTKKNGTGLGLPIVSKIINEHKGELIISKNDPGVKVTIKLPTIG